VVRIPVRPARGIRDKESGLGRGAEFRQIRIRQVPVFADVQPFPGMREGGVRGIAAELK